jgi:hypothetical protein
MRAKDGSGEAPVETYEHFASRDVLRCRAGVSLPAGSDTLRSRSGNRAKREPRCTSKSAVSRTFVARTAEPQGADHTNVVPLGITTEGIKVPLRAVEGLDPVEREVAQLTTDTRH